MTNYRDYIETLSCLFEKFQYNNLLGLVERISQKIENIKQAEKAENCEIIYKKFETNDNFGSHERGCCYDINAVKCKNYERIGPHCLCKEPNIYGKKYLKYKQKYLKYKKIE